MQPQSKPRGSLCRTEPKPTGHAEIRPPAHASAGLVGNPGHVGGVDPRVAAGVGFAAPVPGARTGPRGRVSGSPTRHATTNDQDPARDRKRGQIALERKGWPQHRSGRRVAIACDWAPDGSGPQPNCPASLLRNLAPAYPDPAQGRQSARPTEWRWERGTGCRLTIFQQAERRRLGALFDRQHGAHGLPGHSRTWPAL